MTTRCRFSLLLAILTVLLVGFALRLWHLNTESIWHDEGWSIRAFRGPFTTPDDNTPYLYYLSGHVLWRAGAGETPLALRYVSVLIGTLTVALALRIGRRWYGAGLGVGLLVALSPLLWEYSQEVRAYVAVPLVALGLLAAADAVLKYQRGERVPPRLYELIFGVQLAGLYTHNLAVPLVVWLNAALGLAWLLRRDWRKMLIWAGVEIALIVAYIPWLLTQSPSGTPLNTPPQPGFALIRDVWYSYFLPVLPQLLEAGAVPALDILGLLALVIAVSLVIFHPGRRTWLLLSHVALVPVFSTALMLAANIDFHPRYYIAAAPASLLLLAAGGYALRGRYARVVAYGAVIVVVLAVSVTSISQIRTTRSYQHDDFAGLAAYYATLPPDAVILIPFEAERALQDYYADEIQAQFVNLPLYADETTVIEALNDLVGEGETRHIEFLTWFQLPADARGMYPCLLAANSLAVGEPQTYFGLMTQRYEIGPPPHNLQPLGIQAAYNTVDLSGAAYRASEHGACLRTDWTLNAPLDQNVQIAAALLNPFDAPLVRGDAELTRPDNVGTRAWAAGESGQAYHLLQLPPHAPQMPYDLRLGAYTTAQPSGFDRLDDAGNPAGKTLTMREAITAQGAMVTDYDETVVIDAPQAVHNGLPFDVVLRVVGDEQTLSLSGEEWSLEQVINGAESGVLRWVRFSPPPEIIGSQAILALDGRLLATYDVINTPRQYDPPDYETPVNVDFPGVGELVGVTLPQTTISIDDPPEVTLIWQAEGQTERDYTVFVQLLTPDGRVIAQSDAPPPRPATNWAEGEYLVDNHNLRFNITDYTGPATLIAGLYDADFQRVMTSAGADYVSLPLTISFN